MNRGELSLSYSQAATPALFAPRPDADLDERSRLISYNFNISDLAERVGQIQTGPGAAQAAEFKRLQDQEKKHREHMDRAAQQAMERLEEISRRLEELNQIIADVEREMRETEQLLRSTRAAIEGLQAGQKPNLDEDGNLRDRQLEAALREYERRHGRVDRDNPAELLAALQAIEAAAQNAQQDQTRRHDDATSERDALRAERAEIEERLNQSWSSPDAGTEASRADRFESVSASRIINGQLTELDGDIDDELDMFADMLNADLGGSFADELDIVRGDAVPENAEPASEPRDLSEPDDPIAPQNLGTPPGPNG